VAYSIAEPEHQASAQPSAVSMIGKAPIQIIRVTALNGPNIWTYRPVVEALVDIGTLEDYPSHRIPGFSACIQAWLPGLIEHRCGVGTRGGFNLRLDEGTWAGHIMEHLAIELQNLAGMKTGFGKARQTSDRGIYKVVIRTRHPKVGARALEMARDMIHAAIHNQAFALHAVVAELKDLIDSECLGPSTAHIVEAAAERRIPFNRLNEGNLVQLGHGSRQRRIWTAETDATSAIAESICSDKDLTKQLLAGCGLPVPHGSVVTSAQHAWEAAQELGLPVVVKPTDANHGRGVSLDLRTQEDVVAAFALAQAEGSDVLVERCLQGEEHRLLVVGQRLVAVAKGETAIIHGDGVQTVEMLIDSQLNTDPRRGLTEDFPLNKIVLDKDAAVLLELKRQGVSRTSVLQTGQSVVIQRNGNVANDVTELVHPDVARTAILAARIVGLDIAGIDIVTPDISRPLAEQGGGIVEINAGPGLLMHIKPASGTAQPVGTAIVNHLFHDQPEPAAGRIPLVGVMGGPRATGVAQMTGWLMQMMNRTVGIASQNGLSLNQRRVLRSDATSLPVAQRLLVNRSVDAAVFETPAHRVLSQGIPYDRCLVGVVTDMPSPDGLAPWYIHEPDQLRQVVRCQVDLVLPQGWAILNADELAVAELAELCDGEVVLFSVIANNPVVLAHCANGGKAVFLRRRKMVFAADGTDIEGIDMTMPAVRQLSELHETSPCMMVASAAAAWVQGATPDMIRAALKTYGQHLTAQKAYPAATKPA
jgi:cyanophycin synthetase